MDDKLPLSSYVLMHSKATLTKEEENLLINWFNKTADNLLAAI